MEHYKIFKKENKEYQLEAELLIDTFRNNTFEYRLSLSYRELGKRKWVKLIPYNYHEPNISHIREHLSDDEILSTKMELWQKLKPEV